MTKTTDFQKVKDGAEFTWGKVVKIHEISDISIIEFINGGKTSYMYYVDGKNFNQSVATLDSAIVHAIASKNEGHNSYAAMYFLRMIKA